MQGEERPLHPLTEAGVIPWASRGRVLALRAAGRTNPLTPTPFEVEGGQGSRSDREAAPTLTPWNDPNAQGWWSGALFP